MKSNDGFLAKIISYSGNTLYGSICMHEEDNEETSIYRYSKENVLMPNCVNNQW